MAVLSQHELTELYDQTLAAAGALIERFKDVPEGDHSHDAELEQMYRESIRPLTDKYPDYFNWIQNAVALLDEGKTPSAPETNAVCPNLFIANAKAIKGNPYLLYNKTIVACTDLIEKLRTAPAGHYPSDQQLRALYETHLGPLVKSYPDFENWINSALLYLQDGVKPGDIETNAVHPAPHESKHHLIGKNMRRAFITERFGKPTSDQMLKVMLTTGTSEQVFQAAKHIGMIPGDVPETPENLQKVKTVIATLQWLNDAYTPPGAKDNPLQGLRHAKEYILHGQAEGDSSALIGSTIDGQEVKEAVAGKGHHELNVAIEACIKHFQADDNFDFSIDATHNGLVAMYIKHFAPLYRNYPTYPRYIFSELQSRLSTMIPAWAVADMTLWTMSPHTDFGSPWIQKREPSPIEQRFDEISRQGGGH